MPDRIPPRESSDQAPRQRPRLREGQRRFAMTSSSSHRRQRRGVLALSVSALVLAACSSSPSGSDTGGGGDVAAAVTDNVTKYKALPTFTAPGPAIDISSLSGKSMFLIPLVPNPFNQSIQETMQKI